mgnify:FL=1
MYLWVEPVRLILIFLLGWSGNAFAEKVFIEVKAGERVQDWCKRLAAQDILTCGSVLYLARTENYPAHSFVPGLRDLPTQSKNPFAGNRFEGLLSPGVFAFTDLDLKKPVPDAAGAFEERDLANARKVIKRLLAISAARLEHLPAGKGLQLREQIILASMVEKEAVSNVDHDKVAAVFYNRIARDDKLGSCPTVEYALGFHRPFLLYRDLESVSSSPYNLYARTGLPPTPICFFSDAALAAVKKPRADNSIYFFVFDWTTGKLRFENISDYAKHRENADRAKENYRLKYGDIRQLFPGKFYEQ